MWLEDTNNAGTVVRERVCILEVWAECLGRDPNMITRRDSFEISRAMKNIKGWTQSDRAAKLRCYGVQKVYVRDGNQKGN